jgi:hypothetical protein
MQVSRPYSGLVNFIRTGEAEGCNEATGAPQTAQSLLVMAKKAKHAFTLFGYTGLGFIDNGLGVISNGIMYTACKLKPDNNGNLWGTDQQIYLSTFKRHLIYFLFDSAASYLSLFVIPLYIIFDISKITDYVESTANFIAGTTRDPNNNQEAVARAAATILAFMPAGPVRTEAEAALAGITTAMQPPTDAPADATADAPAEPPQPAPAPAPSFPVALIAGLWNTIIRRANTPPPAAATPPPPVAAAAAPAAEPAA